MGLIPPIFQAVGKRWTLDKLDTNARARVQRYLLRLFCIVRQYGQYRQYKKVEQYRQYLVVYERL